MVQIRDVFPQPNLPQKSQEWGRSITNQVRETGYKIINQGNAISNQNRAMAGQLGAFGRSVAEIQAQSSQVIEVSDKMLSISIPNNQDRTSETSFTIPIPPPSDNSARPAIVQLIAQVSKNSSEFLLDWVFVEAFGIGATGHTGTLGGGFPPGWDWDINLYGTLPPGTTSVEVRMSATASNFTGSSKTHVVGLKNIKLSLMYGG